MIQTHSTRRLDGDDSVTTDGIEPGLTLRDIRFAVQLENLLDSPNNLIARVPDSTNLHSTDRAVAWKILLSKYPFLALEPTKSNSDNADNAGNAGNAGNTDSTDSTDILETLSKLARL